MIELFRAGGPMMYALLAAALVGIAVIFERFVVLQRVPTSKKAEKELEKLLGDHEINKKFMEDRTIFLWDVVHDESASDIVKRLLFLDAQSTKP